MDQPNTTLPLYDRIGGRDGLLRLLKHFYADVRQHNVIGPIFMAKIDNWPAHLEKIADFWLGIEEQHFEAWLGLWHHNCRAHLPETEAQEMINSAEMIGQRLRSILAYHQAVTSESQPETD